MDWDGVKNELGPVLDLGDGAVGSRQVVRKEQPSQWISGLMN